MVGWHYQFDVHELSKLPELVMDREAWHVTVHGLQRVRHAEQLNWAILFSWGSSQPRNQTKVSCISGGFFTISWSLLKLMTIESVMPSNHLTLCCPFLLLPSISQHQGLFQGVSSSHQVAKVLKFQLQHQSFQRIFRTDFL